jgi:hypothetical protein
VGKPWEEMGWIEFRSRSFLTLSAWNRPPQGQQEKADGGTGSDPPSYPETATFPGLDNVYTFV